MATRDQALSTAHQLLRNQDLPHGRRKRLARAVELLQPATPRAPAPTSRAQAEAAFLSAAAALAGFGLTEADLIDLLSDEAACLDRSHRRPRGPHGRS